MLKLLQAVNSFLGSLVALLVLGLLGAGGWYAWDRYQRGTDTLRAKQEEITRLAGVIGEREKQLAVAKTEIEKQAASIVQLEADVKAKQEEIDRLDTAVRLLKIDHRVARLTVLRQSGSAADKNLTTTFSFVELGPGGQPLEAPREFTIDGDVVYIDAWVIKFTDAKVEAGDPLGATSVALFRRIFGEAQQPKEGFVLDKEGERPAAYRATGPVSAVEQKIWSRFWEYANDPQLAQESGVRAAHGEAPSIKLIPGRSYRILLRASGGLSIVPEDAPPSSPNSL
ncbi:MAG: hypothetical protein ACOY3P_04735 [Planctomycetota bacterium]